MDQAQKEELSRDASRFMIIGYFLYSMFYSSLERIISTDRLPLQYFLLAGAAGFAVEVALYFSIRHWPGRWKTAMVSVIGVLWVGVCLFVGR